MSRSGKTETRHGILFWLKYFKVKKQPLLTLNFMKLIINYLFIYILWSIFYQWKITLSGMSQSDGLQKIVEVHDKEKGSLELFLGVQNLKIVELGKVIGIGGEGIVVEHELEIEVMEGTAKNRSSKKADNIKLKSKQRSITAIKFVNFESRADENLQGKSFD